MALYVDPQSGDMVGDSLADRPAAAGMNGGVEFLDLATGRAYITTGVGAARAWRETGVPAANPQVYVNTATGNDATGTGAAASPFATVDAAFALLDRTPYTGFPTINATGTQVVTTSRVWACRGPGVPGGAVLLKGARTNVALPAGAGTVGAGSAAGSTSTTPVTFATIVDAAGGYVANAMVGKFARLVTGTAGNIGRRREIRSNDAASPGTLQLTGTLPAAPLAGDTYVIEQPGFTLDARGASVFTACPAGVVVQDVAVTSTTSFVVLSPSAGDLTHIACTFSAPVSGYFSGSTQGTTVRYGTLAASDNAAAVVPAAEVTGCYFGARAQPGGTATGGAMTVTLSHVELSGQIALQPTQGAGALFVSSCYLNNNTNINVVAGRVNAQISSCLLNGTNTYSLLISQCPNVAVTGVDVSNATGDAVNIQQSRVVFTRLSGAGNAVPFRYDVYSIVQVSDPNTGTTIAGAFVPLAPGNRGFSWAQWLAMNSASGGGNSVNPGSGMFGEQLGIYTLVANLGNLPGPSIGAALSWDGLRAYAVDGRKAGEGAGAGTGVPIYWSRGGPAGAGWYVVGTAALVTA
jgi:hypothetical protein